MVQRTVFIPTRGQRAPPPRTLGLFLEEHMLGVMSEIHEMLQDVQGKKTMSSKRQILRSFGSFVTYIGSAISNVAPQVRLLTEPSYARLNAMIRFSGYGYVPDNRRGT
jgi:serine/threonine-protein kinase ATR